MKKFFLHYLYYPFVRFKIKKGYGTHSPFAFHFITEILNCKYYYYAFSELDDLKEFFSFEPHIKPSKYYHLLYRISNYYNPSRIVTVGINNLSILSSLYLTAPKSDIHTFVLDSILSSGARIEFSESSFFKRLSFLKLENTSSDVIRLLCDIDSIDVLYLSKENDLMIDMWDFLVSCFTKLHNNSLLIIEDISSSDKASLLWEKVCECSHTTVTFDIKDVGIAFFSDSLYKKNYKLYL